MRLNTNNNIIIFSPKNKILGFFSRHVFLKKNENLVIKLTFLSSDNAFSDSFMSCGAFSI